MIHFDPCATCDFRDSPHVCHARVTGHRAFCGDPRYREIVRRMTLGIPMEPEPVQQPMPGLLEKAGNLARAVVTHVADGGRIASPEVQAERKAICFSCSHLDKARDKCNVCGCSNMDLKRSWASSACPLSPPRWEAV